MTKHRGEKRTKRQFFRRNVSALIEKAVAVIIHRGVMIKHRGEKRRKGQLFQRNASALIEKASAFKIHHGEKVENGAMA